MIIDAKDLILGRMCTVIAKKAILGEKIDIVNCEKAIVIGSKQDVFAKYKKRDARGGPFHGPFIPKMPDKFVRRAIRGMLPYKQHKGSVAFDRIMCHISIPNKFKDKKLETVKEADSSKMKTLKYLTVGRICNSLKGGRNYD